MRDRLLWFYGLVVALAFVVSAPASFVMLRPYHDSGVWYGLGATWALLVILEIGSVAAKVATLSVEPTAARVLEWACRAGLGINALSNFAAGVAVARLNGLSGYAALYGGAVVYAALPPAIIYLMLYLAVQRLRWLAGRPPASIEAQVAAQLAGLQRAALVLAESRRMLAEQQLLALPAQSPQLALPSAQEAICASCGHAFRSTAQQRAYVRHGCPGCGATGAAVLGGQQDGARAGR